jgi:hypothetical protein
VVKYCACCGVGETGAEEFAVSGGVAPSLEGGLAVFGVEGIGERMLSVEGGVLRGVSEDI